MSVSELKLFNMLLITVFCSIVTKCIAETSFMQVEAVVGGNAKFPCNISSVTPDDTMALVIWFKGEIPIYSYDLRDGGELEDAKHWAAEDIIDRAQYTVTPADSYLVLESVMEADGGQIKCRIDFYHTPTRNSFFNLTVTVPPESMELTDPTGRAVAISTMPVIEGESLQIICLALGGKPVPKVRWTLNEVVIDESDEQMSGNSVRNVLVLDNLERRHLGSQLTCQASNTKLIPPLSTTVAIELYLRPLEVKLLGENLALSAGSKYEVACRCSGSRPPANITWWKGGQALRGFTRETMSSDGNVTLATLTIDPQPNDSGKTLSCRTSNIHYPSVELQDSWILNVHFAPIISLNVRNDTNSSRIREGMDVYLECRIQANPPVDKILWTYNGDKLNFNSSNWETKENQTLILKSVSRKLSGVYTCLTSNAEGESASDPFVLDVKYEPSCSSKHVVVQGTARGEELTVACSVEANPPASRFKWTFNSSSSSDSNNSSGRNASRSLDAAAVTSGGRSVVTYRPLLETDFGTILCSAENEMGIQASPCVFQIVPAGKPDPPHNCSIASRSHNWVQVSCS
ncbi:nephrin [Nilaparvata lugens]|uniref:nephrin n=1 Tax=Nilaparvata lugens TaxID=108931 RepID=UPI00193E330C|nr:nephrin [Nilaparvata lugens]